MGLIKRLIFRHYKLHYHRSCRIDHAFPGMVEIGENLLAGPGSVIVAHDSALLNKTGEYVVAKVKIGDNVFLGANSVVCPGVTIGDNAVIGAGSVVTHDIPAGAVASGNPAKVLFSVEKYRALMRFKGRLRKL